MAYVVLFLQRFISLASYATSSLIFEVWNKSFLKMYRSIVYLPRCIKSERIIKVNEELKSRSPWTVSVSAWLERQRHCSVSRCLPEDLSQPSTDKNMWRWSRISLRKDLKNTGNSSHFWARWCAVQTWWLNWSQTSCWRADCEQCGEANPAAASAGCGWLGGAAWGAAERSQSAVLYLAHLSCLHCRQRESALETEDCF